MKVSKKWKRVEEKLLINEENESSLSDSRFIAYTTTADDTLTTIAFYHQMRLVAVRIIVLLI